MTQGKKFTPDNIERLIENMINLAREFDRQLHLSARFDTFRQKTRGRMLRRELETNLTSILPEIVVAANLAVGEDEYFLGPDSESVGLGPVELSPHVTIDWRIRITGEIYIVVYYDNRMFTDLVIQNGKIESMDYFGNGGFQQAHAIAFRAIKAVTDEATALKALWNMSRQENGHAHLKSRPRR